MHLRNRLIGNAGASEAPGMDEDSKSNDSLRVEVASPGARPSSPSNSQPSSGASQEAPTDNSAPGKMHQATESTPRRMTRGRPPLRELRPKPRERDLRQEEFLTQPRLLTSSNATTSRNTPFQSESEAPWSPHNHPLDAERRQQEMKRKLSTDTLGEPSIGDLEKPEHDDKAYSELQSMEKRPIEAGNSEENTGARGKKRQKKIRGRASSAEKMGQPTG
ncbi:hypothetical protein PVAG01_00757 [Phlyctema vagabunda]|uniref:Uncharacterized protein n=1 Tax=Phlyctema vagabunda TaxID=108571 RepID=A0ABR4PV71_9HELO